MGLIVPVTSELWGSIYYQIRDHLLKSESVHWANRVAFLEDRFADMGIILHRDEPRKSWSHVEFTDDVDVTELVLRWGNGPERY